MLAVWCAAGAASAAVRMDPLAGTWRDDFTDLTGLDAGATVQGAFLPPSGFTVTPELITWSQPACATCLGEPFSGTTTYDPTVEILGKGSAAEQLTLWRKRYDPGGALEHARGCVANAPCTCRAANNGMLATQELRGIWTEGSAVLPGAVWGAMKEIEVNSKSDCLGDPCTPCLTSNTAVTLAWTNHQNCAIEDGAPRIPSIAAFTNEALLFFGGSDKGTTDLRPGYPYTITFLASAFLGMKHVGHADIPYLKFAVRDSKTKAELASAVLRESEFLLNAGQPSVPPVSFAQDVTPVTLELNPLPATGHPVDFRAISLVPARDDALSSSVVTCGLGASHPHFTILGPVYATAARGSYVSPVLDSLSDHTRWRDIRWELRMNTLSCTFCTTDPDPESFGLRSTKDNREALSSVSLLPDGSPLTPVALSYRIGDASPPAFTRTVSHGGEQVPGLIGMNMADVSATALAAVLPDGSWAQATGRYFQYRLDLYGRGAARELDGDLAPRNGINPNSNPDPHARVPYPDFLYFGGFRPVVSGITVRYNVCAARAVSRRIAPTSVKRWGTVAFTLRLPSASCRVGVDVLAPDGTIVAANVRSGDSLAAVDPFRYPALRLSASLFSDPADCAASPALLAWGVTWEPLVEVIALACNSIRPRLGEACALQLRVPTAGRARVAVHDASGQEVKVLLDEEVAAEARLLAWRGENDRGDVVAPGVYFVAARIPGGAREVKRLAVIR